MSGLVQLHKGSQARHGQLYLKQTRHHLMRQDDWLELALGLALVAVLPGQHIHLPLVKTQLANVCLQWSCTHWNIMLHGSIYVTCKRLATVCLHVRCTGWNSMLHGNMLACANGSAGMGTAYTSPHADVVERMAICTYGHVHEPGKSILQCGQA